MAWPARDPSRPPTGWGPPPPRPPQPRPEPEGDVWTLVPLVTFGFGTPFSFLYAALVRRSWGYGTAALLYGLLLVSIFFSGQYGPYLWLLTWIGGTVHAFAVRRDLYPRRTIGDHVNRQAIAAAQHRRQLRQEARTLAATDPTLAVELRIGRPDLPRTYDDGGLIDINHAAPPVLGLLPGITDEQVARIVRLRATQGGFVSVEELAVDADLPPDLTSTIAEYTIFLR